MQSFAGESEIIEKCLMQLSKKFLEENMEGDINTMQAPPVYEEPQPKRNRTIIIVLVILLVLCCCCMFSSAIGWWGWNNGDQLMEEYMSLLNLGIL